MEEKRPGQHPETDRPADDPQQNRAVRPGGGEARGGLDPTDRDLALLREAGQRGQQTASELREGGFGDHKGVEGFPAIDRDD